MIDRPLPDWIANQIKDVQFLDLKKPEYDLDALELSLTKADYIREVANNWHTPKTLSQNELKYVIGNISEAIKCRAWEGYYFLKWDTLEVNYSKATESAIKCLLERKGYVVKMDVILNNKGYLSIRSICWSKI